MSMHGQELQALQCLANVALIRVGEHGVLAHDEQALELALGGGVDRGGHRQARLRPADSSTPQAFSNFARDGRVGDLLVAREDVGQGAHVAGPLDVVLAAQRVDARARAADVAGEHGQVGAGLDVVHAVVCWVMPME